MEKYSISPICTFKYHVFAPMGRFQFELIYLYFLPSFHLTDGKMLDGRTVENKGKLIPLHVIKMYTKQVQNVHIEYLKITGITLI